MAIRFPMIEMKGNTTRFAEFNDYRITGRELVMWPLESKRFQRQGKTTRFVE